MKFHRTPPTKKFIAGIALMLTMLLTAGSASAAVDISFPNQAGIPAGSAEGLPLVLSSDAPVALRIQATMVSSVDSGWTVTPMCEYISLEQGQEKTCNILVGASGYMGDTASITVKVKNLTTGVIQDFTCDLESSPRINTGEEEYFPPASGDDQSGRKASLFDTLQQLSNHFQGAVVWEIGEWPLGYPYSKDPIAYSNQDIDVSMGIKNVDTAAHEITYVLRISKKGAGGAYAQVAQLATATVNVAGQDTVTVNTTWNTGTEVQGEYRFELTGAGGKIGSAQFQIGRSQSAKFVDCASEEAKYDADETVILKQTATIENTGNVDLSGVLQVILYKYDDDGKKWDQVELLYQQAGVVIARGGTYSLAGAYPIDYELPQDPAEAYGDYRLSVRLSESAGLLAAIVEFIIGAKVIGYLENALPTLALDRSVGEDANSNGDLDPGEVGKLSASDTTKNGEKNVLVKYAVAPPANSNSLRSAGHFVVGEDLATELDIVFVCDTSGSMGSEWSSLTTIMSSIIGDLSDLADVNHDIYAMSNYYGGYTTYTVDGVVTDVLVLTQHPTGHSESWGPATEYLANNYPWRQDAIRVILPVSDEGAYNGNNWDANDTNSVTSAITACNNNQVIAYPMYGDWYSTSQGTTYILPNMQRLASNTGGQAFYWGDNQSVIDTLTAALGQQIEFSARDITVYTDLTKDKTLADAHNWLAAWLGGGNSAKVVRKTAGSADSQTDWGALQSTDWGDTQGYVFSADSGNTSALFQSLSMAPLQQLEITLGFRIPSVGAGLTYTFTDNTDFITFQDAFTGEEVMFPELAGTPMDPVLIRADEPTGDVLIVTDEPRMRDVFGDTKTNAIMTKLTNYAATVDATFLDVGEFREEWEEQNNNNTGAFAGIYTDAEGAACSAAGRYDWNTTGPDTRIKYPKFLDELIGGYALARDAKYVTIVGGDNIIPYQRIACPRNNWETDYLFINNNVAGRNRMWSDVPYVKLNADKYPDIGISRLIGSPAVITATITSGMATQPEQTKALVGTKQESSAVTQNHVEDVVDDLWGYTFGPSNQNDNKYLDEYVDAANTQDIQADFVAALPDDYPFIFVKMHGNNYRDAGANQQRITQHSNGLLVRPTDLNGHMGHHPIWIGSCCHGGATYSDDTIDNNFPAKFLKEGGAGFVGCTAYSPSYMGMDFFEPLFEELFEVGGQADNIGQAVHKARRDVLGHAGNLYELCAVGYHHYGLPTVQPDLRDPPPRKASNDYTFDVQESGTQYTLNLDITSWTVNQVNTAQGLREYVYLDNTSIYNQEGYPPVPVISYQIALPPEITVADLVQINATNDATIPNLNMPQFQPATQASGDAVYTGQAFAFAGIYPQAVVVFEVIGEINGQQTVGVNIYPVQWDPATQQATIHQDITVVFDKEDKAPAPLSQLEVSRVYDEADGIMQLIVRNPGGMDAANLVLVETIPDGVIPDPDSIGNATVGARKAQSTLMWSLGALSNLVPDNFAVFTYVPLTSMTGDYQFTADLNYESSAGVAGDPVQSQGIVNLRKSIEAEQEEDIVAEIQKHSEDCFVSSVD